MSKNPRTPEETYGPALRKAQLDFGRVDPHKVASHAGVAYQATGTTSGQFLVPFLSTMHRIHWPEGTVEQPIGQQETDIGTRILALHYLVTADGSPVAGKWIAFRNLPGGLGYDGAFQRRANLRLANAFGTDLEAFVTAAKGLGGERLTFGDASYLFRALPRVWLAVVHHVADEEFPASTNIVFDASVSHYLPTEDLAVLGGMLAGRLIKAAQARLASAPGITEAPRAV